MDAAADSHPDAADATPEIFPVHFGKRAAFGIVSPAQDSLALGGGGELEISGDTLAIRGPKPRSFRAALAQQHVFPLVDIANVMSAGKSLRFAIPPQDGHARFVQMEAIDEAAVQRIVALLPDRITPEFAVERAEREEFHERLVQLTRTPRVTPVLIAINVVVFVLMTIAGVGIFEPDGELAVGWGTNFGPLTMAGGQWWRLFTCTFVHFGIIHLALNMWALYTSGLMTERLYGSGRFAMLYVFSGLAGSIASLLWNPVVNSAGASGAIFGVFGGLLAFVVNPRNGVPRSVMTEHRNSTLIFAGYSLFYGAANAGVDNAAHVGGLVGGFLVGLLLARPLDERRLSNRGGFRLLLAAVAAVLVLAASLMPLVNASDIVRARQSYELALLGFDAREESAMQAMRDAIALATPDTPENNAIAARAIMANVAPKWAEMYRQVAAHPLAESDPQAHRQQLLMRYLDGRRRYCELLARSVLEDSQALHEQAVAAEAESTQAVEELNALSK